MHEFDPTVLEMMTIRDVLDDFRERAKVVSTREWIWLQQVFITRLREKRDPTRAELDEFAPKHVVSFRSGPDVSLNWWALELSGIDRDLRIPRGVLGRIERDEVREPTRIIRSGAHLRMPGCGAFWRVRADAESDILEAGRDALLEAQGCEHCHQVDSCPTSGTPNSNNSPGTHRRAYRCGPRAVQCVHFTCILQGKIFDAR